MTPHVAEVWSLAATPWPNYWQITQSGMADRNLRILPGIKQANIRPRH